MALELLRPRHTTGNGTAAACDRSAPAGGENQRVWEGDADRRGALSQLIALAVACIGSPHGPRGRRAELEAALRRVLNARVVAIRDGGLPAGADATRIDANVLRVALPVTGRPALHLEVTLGHGRPLEAEARERLLDAARVAGLALSAAAESGAVPDERFANPSVDSPRLVGAAEPMIKLRHEISRVAATAFTVLIEGESGSGKELVARRIHDESERRPARFIGVNCAALVETLLEAELFGIEDRTATGVRGRRGKFELADGGTLFLDEISDLSPAAQAKLLRAIQEMSVERVGGHTTRAVDARLIVATNQSLRKLVAAGRFRSDLYYRLSGLEIRVPPLRERRGDILALANHFLGRYRAVRPFELSRSAVDALLTYDWPGNVRELERVIERAVALATSAEITTRDLPPTISRTYDEIVGPSLQRDDTMRAWGSRYARVVLDRCNHNKREACRMLGISYHTLQAYLTYKGPKSGQEPATSPAQTPQGAHSAPRRQRRGAAGSPQAGAGGSGRSPV